MDPRNFSAGREIPSQYYVDQPYFVVTPGGEWVCVLTTGGDREGGGKEHDQGHSDTPPWAVQGLRALRSSGAMGRKASPPRAAHQNADAGPVQAGYAD